MTKKKEEETALAIVEPETDVVVIDSHRLDYEPQDAGQASRLAEWVCRADFWPALKTKEKALMVMMQGKELGMSTMQALNGIHIIEGKPSLAAQSMVALIKMSDKCAFFKCTEQTDKSATWETLRADDPTGETATATFTIKQAEKRGYLKRKGTNWSGMPEIMLMWRAATMLARQEYPDIVMGLYDADELRDHAKPKERIPKTVPISGGVKLADPDFDANTGKFTDETDAPSEASELTINEVKSRIKMRKKELGSGYCYFEVGANQVDASDLHAVLACLDAVRDHRLACLSNYEALAKRLGWSATEVTHDLGERFELKDPTECTAEQLEEAALSMRASIKEQG